MGRDGKCKYEHARLRGHDPRDCVFALSWQRFDGAQGGECRAALHPLLIADAAFKLAREIAKAKDLGNAERLADDIRNAAHKQALKTTEFVSTTDASITYLPRWRFREDPPVLTRVDAETEKKVIGSLVEYCETIPVERRFMLKRYRAIDIVHRIVGVGSVGTRAYLVLLLDVDG